MLISRIVFLFSRYIAAPFTTDWHARTDEDCTALTSHSLPPSHPPASTGKMIPSLALVPAPAPRDDPKITRSPEENACTSTLNLPRLLCLHGGGANARIFRAQCRVLERALFPTCRLCFAEAPFPSQAGPDVVSVYAAFSPFKAWLHWGPDDAERDSGTAVVREIQSALLYAMAEDE
jgi:hypothetical protein